MKVEVKVPVLSESVAEATLVSWNKKEGEYIERDENLIDIETDKIVIELPAPISGRLTKIIKDNGATVVSGELIATIDSEDTVPIKGEKKAFTKDATIEPVMMPAAKRIASEKNLSSEEVSTIHGSGLGGRITKEDVVGYKGLQSIQETYESEETKLLNSDRPEKRVPMSRLRLRIAERMVQSQSTAAILTTFNEVDMQAIIDSRTRYKERFKKEYGVKLGFTSFFVKAVVDALKKFPIVNSSVDGKDIIYHGYYDIGIAVGSPRGLVVPIIRNADCLSQAEIEIQINDFGIRANEGKLKIEELTGGTFSITNGGVFGSMLSTPIINPPQSAILGVHAIKERPVAINGGIVIRPMNYLALSYDHRIVDGREAVLSLVAIKDALESPMSPFLEE